MKFQKSILSQDLTTGQSKKKTRYNAELNQAMIQIVENERESVTHIHH